MNRARGVLALLLLAGCASSAERFPRPAPETVPAGSPLRSMSLSDGDAWLRHHLMYGEYSDALAMLRPGGSVAGDRLLGALQEGLVLHRAGEYARSNEVLEWAEREADRRYTRSLSRAAASLGISDRALAYTPSAAELTMVPFYRMLNYLALGETTGALVEARKSNALLARSGAGGGHRCRAEPMLLYLAGLVQSAGGERNDALVSLRQAETAFEACGTEAGLALPPSFGADLYGAARALGIQDLSDSIAARYGLPEELGDAGGDVLLVIEQGFVSHLTPEALHVPIFPEDVDGLDGGDADELFSAAGRILERLVDNGLERAAWGVATDDLPVVQWANALSGAHVLRLAWPVARRESAGPAAVRAFIGDSLALLTTAGDVSALVEREVEAERPAMAARLLARGLARYLLAREVEETAVAEAGELAGFLAGRFVNLAANQLERPDTRTWSLLPDRISLVRLRLPPGAHRIRLETVSQHGEVRLLDLGEVEARPGRLVARIERVWDG